MRFQKLRDTDKNFHAIWQWAKRLVEDLNKPSTDVPIGSMMVWPIAAVPLNWLACDGATVNTADYSVLFLLLGNTSGATFELPTAFPASPISEGHQIIIKAK